MICDMVDRRVAGDPALAKRFPDCPPARQSRCRELINFVQDRPGHDRRYAICAGKIASQLGFRPRTVIKDGLEATVDWYLANENWWKPIQSGQYRDWMRRQYGMAT
jgi:dTDP-glucose 4,6-dehydratase